MNNCFVKEIFSSIQGEGLYIGEKQLFIRFCGCNLNCGYCDTDFAKEDTFPLYNLNKFFSNPICANKLKEIVELFPTQTISLTGGEPLLYSDFLALFLPLIPNRNIYLETNGTLPQELSKIINYVDIVAMDIKLSFSTKEKNQFDNNEEFIKIAKNSKKEIFAKIIIGKNYSKDELKKAIDIVKKHAIPLILQPMDCKDKTNILDKNDVMELIDFSLKNYSNIRFIPQMHKYLNLL